MLKVNIRTPGKTLRVPGKSLTLRTPCEFIIDDSRESQLDLYLRMRLIEDYSIERIEGKEETDKNVKRRPLYSSRHGSGLSLNFGKRGRRWEENLYFT